MGSSLAHRPSQLFPQQVNQVQYLQKTSLQHLRQAGKQGEQVILSILRYPYEQRFQRNRFKRLKMFALPYPHLANKLKLLQLISSNSTWGVQFLLLPIQLCLRYRQALHFTPASVPGGWELQSQCSCMTRKQWQGKVMAARSKKNNCPESDWTRLFRPTVPQRC